MKELDVAGVKNNLAIFCRRTNRLAEARPLYDEALRIRELSYGQ